MGRKKIIRPKDLFSLPHDKLLQKKTPLPTKEEIEKVKGKAISPPI